MRRMKEDLKMKLSVVSVILLTCMLALLAQIPAAACSSSGCGGQYKTLPAVPCGQNGLYSIEPLVGWKDCEDPMNWDPCILYPVQVGWYYSYQTDCSGSYVRSAICGAHCQGNGSIYCQ